MMLICRNSKFVYNQLGSLRPAGIVVKSISVMVSNKESISVWRMGNMVVLLSDALHFRKTVKPNERGQSR